MDQVQRVRTQWPALIGKPSPRAIWLNVNVLDAEGKQIDYNLHGTVDVPGAPRNDDERALLAQVLFRAADIPDKAIRRYRLACWEEAEGGSGVKIEHCEPIHVLSTEDIIDLKCFQAPEIDENGDGNPPDDEMHHAWTREYGSNRYCRFESRRELNQRYQDIHANTLLLNRSGKLALSQDHKWYRLLQHVLDEMCMRGEPPAEHNFEPSVRSSFSFADGELCRKAAEVTSSRGTNQSVLVKYGKYEHMRQLLKHGQLRLQPATAYTSSTNQAIQDNEREFVLKGGWRPTAPGLNFFDRATVPTDIVEGETEGDVEFVPIFNAPELSRSQCAEVQLSMRNYWTYCLAGTLEPRLFADFEADACVVVRKKQLLERLLPVVHLHMTKVQVHLGPIVYLDPLGSLNDALRRKLIASIPVHMIKSFRYAYQREVRLACVPFEPLEDLEPLDIEIGSIQDIAELIEIG